MTQIDPISTSPKAKQAYELMQILNPLIGFVEASSFMMKGNDLLGGDTPILAIKQDRLDDVNRAVRAVALEKGIFD